MKPVTAQLDLLSPTLEVAVVTTDLAPMIEFYENFLGLEFQSELDFPGGSQRRYALGGNVVKLVTYTPAPALPATPGGGKAQAGIKYFSFAVKNLTALAERAAQSPYEVVEPLTEFEPVPGMGFLFIADPDGNWIEFFGTL
ncbi:extradiol dioxygenase [Mycobacterium sp. MS1601]|nr:extradiol dioxygenase [Mycobacterium sp. MS1601]